jgi:hypothetical protein
MQSAAVLLETLACIITRCELLTLDSREYYKCKLRALELDSIESTIQDNNVVRDMNWHLAEIVAWSEQLDPVCESPSVCESPLFTGFLVNLIEKARKIEATLTHEVEMAKDEYRRTLYAMNDLNNRVAEQNQAAPCEDVVCTGTCVRIVFESDEEDEDEQNAPVQTKYNIFPDASKELRSRIVYYRLF